MRCRRIQSTLPHPNLHYRLDLCIRTGEWLLTRSILMSFCIGAIQRSTWWMVKFCRKLLVFQTLRSIATNSVAPRTCCTSTAVMEKKGPDGECLRVGHQTSVSLRSQGTNANSQCIRSMHRNRPAMHIQNCGVHLQTRKTQNHLKAQKRSFASCCREP